MLSNEAMSFILDRAGKIFDPVVAKVFVQQLGLYPVGSVVELDTGAVGIVVAPGGREVARPVVKVLRTGGRDVTAPYTLNLGEGRGRRIVGARAPSPGFGARPLPYYRTPPRLCSFEYTDGRR